MLCSFMVAGINLIYPLITRYITKSIIQSNSSMKEIYGTLFIVGFVLLALIIVQLVCNFYVDYKGHSMGAMMERDMRNELFEHYQKLTFSFYDEQKIGKLMSRITNDLLSNIAMN